MICKSKNNCHNTGVYFQCVFWQRKTLQLNTVELKIFPIFINVKIAAVAKQILCRKRIRNYLSYFETKLFTFEKTLKLCLLAQFFFFSCKNNKFFSFQYNSLLLRYQFLFQRLRRFILTPSHLFNFQKILITCYSALQKY